ncbi:hypothetical protein [uncultured Granulicatella sp.]|uniref:hypothetical protein n=1 Tax=uncultured Granulicatella sp. TaxID=316089 RepID=UPI0028EA6349|nr:hypothetical protein [uncultured Granulicatella sp.]
MNKKKVILISGSIFVILSVFLLFIPIAHQLSTNKKIDAIEQQFQDFSKEETREEKLKRFKSLTDEYQTYQKDKGTNGKLTETYSHTLSEMKHYFTDNNQIVLRDNTIIELEKENDLENLQTKKSNLEALLSTITQEKEILSNDSTIEETITKIHETIEKMNSRIQTITEEQEKRAKVHYENEYFTIDFPEKWVNKWTVQITKQSKELIDYNVSFGGTDPSLPLDAGIIDVYVFPSSTTYTGKVLPELRFVGTTSNNDKVYLGIGTSGTVIGDNKGKLSLK